MAQSLESLVVDLRARTKNLERDLDKANRKIATKMQRQGRTMANELSSGFSKAFGKLAAITGVAVSFGALQNAIRTTVQESSQLQTTADKLGLTTTALQELRYAGEQFNINQSTTDMALQRFSRRLAEAAQGGGELKATLDQYGIAVRDNNGQMRGTLDVLRDFADVVQDAESSQEQLRIAFKAFDSEGVSFVNILRDGAAGLSQLQAEAHAFGQVIEAENIRRLDKLNSQLQRFKGGWKTIFTELVGDAVSLSDAMGITGLEGRLDDIEKKLSAANRAAAMFADGQNIRPMDAMLYGKDVLDPTALNKLRMERQVVLGQIVQDMHEAFNDMGLVIGESRQLQAQFSESDPAYKLLGERIRMLSLEYSSLTKQQQELLARYPEAFAMFQELRVVVQEETEAITLSAAETSQLQSILAGAKTEAEQFRDKVAILGKAMEVFPERAQEFYNAIQVLTTEYQKSLDEEKLNAFGKEWESLGERISGSLAEAFIEGGDALDNFLERSLRKLAAAQLESAIFQPLFSGLFGGAGGSSFFKFGLPGFASGGTPPVGSPYVVGEHGPEIRMDNRPGTILPNSVLNSLSGTASTTGGDMITITQHIHFDVGLESVDRRIASAAPIIATATEAKIQDTRRRRGRL